MPRVLQLHLSWDQTDEQALANAMTEWPNGGMEFARPTSAPRTTSRRWPSWCARTTSRAGW